MRADSDEFMMSSIEYVAREYRYRNRNRLVDDTPVEVHVPDWYARRLVERYGSLRAAAHTIFDAGRVKIVNAHYNVTNLGLRENVERRFEHPVGCGVDDLTRIALRSYHVVGPLPLTGSLVDEIPEEPDAA